jgi:hypothetical protein
MRPVSPNVCFYSERHLSTADHLVDATMAGPPGITPSDATTCVRSAAPNACCCCERLKKQAVVGRPLDRPYPTARPPHHCILRRVHRQQVSSYRTRGCRESQPRRMRYRSVPTAIPRTMPMLNFFDPSCTGDLRHAKWCCGERIAGNRRRIMPRAARGDRPCCLRWPRAGGRPPR